MFILKYRKLQIGCLYKYKDEWIFFYSSDFKKQNKIVPIFSFEDLNKQYRSKELFPYFQARIPSVKNPNVKEIIDRKKIDANNETVMLKEFGKETITNPFKLEYVADFLD